MYTNTLKAIYNIKKFKKFDFDEIYPKNSEILTVNKIQNVGDALETYIKDAYSNGFDIKDKKTHFSKFFSYLGNNNNPPDSILKNGDAIEVKKMESYGNIQLNSSFPKSKLLSNDSLITTSCKNCEDESWTEKDIIYAIGNFKKRSKKLRSLLLIYGNCFAADSEVYLNVKERISDSITSLPDSELTNELGRINKVDPLGVTKLRVRGMWLLEHPMNIFKDIFEYDEKEESFTLISLMLKEKFESFPNEDIRKIKDDKDIILKNIRICNPNNPANLLDAIMIKVVI